ncbi:MAG: ATP-dependent helicase HrpB [Gammaproteobacteria bacterium]|nr:ATP-dependent helicase HrpB [Gammaproteobacteria bacterium]
MSDFPIDEVLPEIRAHLAAATRLVLEAPPGAGKTTQVPLALLDAAWCAGRVLLLEPRRVAARAAAGFMAAQCGEAVGETVGYRMRFESRVSARTRIEVVTEGILTRLVQDDPTLEGISAVIFDEFHERNLASDLGLALVLDVQDALRADLRVVVMSATLDGARLAAFLDAARVSAPGRSHPVTIEHFAARRDERLEMQLRRAVVDALAAHPGDVLCFLPGRAEIERSARLLGDVDAEVCVLHGELPVAEQAAVLNPGKRRRVVLATNVAESSVTLPGVRVVVDSGLAREPRFDPVSGLSRLETVTITEPSATQRAGRAGRVAAGHCYRLWPASQRLEPATRPELAQVELSGLVLETRAWGGHALRFLDPPPPGALAQAEDLLTRLGALDAAGRITAHGRRLLALGVSPRLANAIERAPPALRGLACDVAALFEARDPLRGEGRRDDDLGRRLAALAALRSGERVADTVDRRALATIDRAARQWRRRAGVDAADTAIDLHGAGTIVALAYPERIAHHDAGDALRYRLANGRGARLAAESALAGTPWLAVAELRREARDSLVLRAAPLDAGVLATLYPARFTRSRTVAFVRERRAVEAREEERFDAIVIASRRVPPPRDERTAAALLAGVLELGLDSLPWSEGLREWQARVAFLRAHCPELGLPDVGDAALRAAPETWLAPLLAGRLALDEISPAAFAQALHARLDHAAQRALDEYAPTAVGVPSGRTLRLAYAAGEAPVLAVKLQELFGLADGPHVARGRIAVVLHLLSPRGAPLQVTRDLRSFWSNTYPAVKKEMKGRYPKHPWPDDPWTAAPTARAKPRKR